MIKRKAQDISQSLCARNKCAIKAGERKYAYYKGLPILPGVKFFISISHYLNDIQNFKVLVPEMIFNDSNQNIWLINGKIKEMIMGI